MSHHDNHFIGAGHTGPNDNAPQFAQNSTKITNMTFVIFSNKFIRIYL